MYEAGIAAGKLLFALPSSNFCKLSKATAQLTTDTDTRSIHDCRNFANYCSLINDEVPKRKFPSESSQAKDPKRKFPNERSQAKVPNNQ